MAADLHLWGDIWFWLLGFVLILYVVLDGFDLGAGILFLGTKDDKRRQMIVGGLGYTWHANQTWLVVWGGLLFGAFPLAYGVLLSALYIPIGLMLLGLILRGVSFEFRKEARHKAFWDLAFGGGSLLAALAQGFVLGGVVSGLKMTGDTYAGGVWDWFNPFTLLVSVGLVFGYLQLGAVYLLIKTTDEMQTYCRKLASLATIFSFFAALGVIIWSWQIHPSIMQKWTTWPCFWITAFPALLTLPAFFWLIKTLRAGKSETAPFVLAALIFALLFGSLAGSLHPFILPPAMTLEAAASQPLTLKVMLLVIVPLLPVMLIYNAYQYRVFRGKAGAVYGFSGDKEKSGGP
jgi:cytochrome d ubiquinol oxidase subunit II